MYKEGEHCGCKYRVNENGDCFTLNGNFEFVHREWHYNHDGYPVVSAVGQKPNGEKIYRSLQVHILVAKEFVDGWFAGAEVNHKDFNRANPFYWNLEWVTHQENIKYSHEAGKYKGKFGKDNPNYGRDTLHRKYTSNPRLAKEKQSRPRGQNGRAKPCVLCHEESKLRIKCDCQRDAVDELISAGVVFEGISKEHVIKKLKADSGYKGWHLEYI